MSVQIEKNTTKTPSPPLGEKERKGPSQTPDDDDVDVERRATMMTVLLDLGPGATRHTESRLGGERGDE